MMSITFEQYWKRLAAIASLIIITFASPILANNASPAQSLGWVEKADTFCGGYYTESLLLPSETRDLHAPVHITGDDTLFSQHGTTTIQGNVLFSRQDERMRADKASLYREPTDIQHFSLLELTGHVSLREPNTMVVAERATYQFQSKEKILSKVMYRLLMQGHRPVGRHYLVQQKEVNEPGGALTAWGSATRISQTGQGVMALKEATYSTCPPTKPVWLLKAEEITLDRESGRGSANHVTVRVKDVPVFYLPYLNFPIDARRKTGFLWPSIGTQNGSPYLSTPVYWNIAPNYDMLVTPTLFSHRGFMFADQFRYLHQQGRGDVNVTLLPDDRYFGHFQEDNSLINPSDPSTIQASKIRLANASTFRQAFVLHDDSRYNANWSSHVNISHTSDDYFLRDFGSTLHDVTQNQLLQEAELAYQSQHWRFIGRIQAYQTLHPFNETVTLNQYRRFPQLILNASYPDQWGGLEYFMGSEITNFDIRKTPGANTVPPVGQRGNLQPGLSLPLISSYGFITPRIQVALSQYTLHQTSETITPTPNTISRALPIIDIASGAVLERDFSVASHAFKQTLEPQIYYTYIPYRKQFDIPLFDTTVNTPTYDQLFNYNRFSGLDRIGDANQLGVGVSSRLIDHDSGLEKVKVGIGDIIYFANRRVTLCQNKAICNDYPEAHANLQRFSPISGTLDYHIIPSWNINSNVAWDPVSKQIENSSISFHYQRDANRIVNLGLNYVNNSALATINDVPVGLIPGNEPPITSASLKVTDASVLWPVTTRIAGLGRISHDWASGHLQNVLYGIQYDTCCVTVRLVGNRAFLGINPYRNNRPQYNNEFYIQLSLKGLGNVGNGNPQSLLTNITGYTNTQFG